MSLIFYESPLAVIMLITKLTSFTVIITALQSLVTLKGTYANGKIWSWEIVKHHHRFAHNSFITWVLSKVMKYPNIGLVFMMRLIAGICLLFIPLASFWAIFALIIVFLTLGLVQYVQVNVQSGGDSMLMILVTALCVLQFSPSDKLVQQLFLGFVSFLLVFSYGVLGYSKAKSVEWRKGEIDVRLFKDPGYVSKRFAHYGWLYPKILKYLGFVVIFWQITLPFSLVLDTPYFLIYLAIGVGFHLFNAFFLGLNLFLLSWLSGYPALFYSHLWIRNIVF